MCHFDGFPGNTTLDELMTQLIQAVEVFNQQLKVDIAEEVLRHYTCSKALCPCIKTLYH